MTPRHSGSVQRGFGEWLLQRMTALYLAGFVLWLGVTFLITPINGFPGWKHWLGSGTVRMAVALSIFCVLVHAWIGMRSVYLDYLKPMWLRISMHLLTAGFLVVMAFWSAHILLIVAVQ